MFKENEVTNLSAYNAGMKKSCLDKVFYMDKLDANIFVDFGCTDGTMISFLNILFPEYTYFGYDISPEMIKLASEKCLPYASVRENGEGNMYFASNWDSLMESLSKFKENHKEQKIALVMNSVIHEIYSYGTKTDVDNTWKNVFSGIFDYIVIRDMISSSSIDRVSDINDVAKILRSVDSRLIRDFEQNWGNIEQNKNLIHFLLKYRYEDNWKREVMENYFPITKEELLSIIPKEYNIEFYEYFTLPFLKLSVKKDFGIDLKDKTHIKLILKKDN